ncbi:Nitronate monooxygenase [Beijerinckiaceae bacterium RH AL1]|nr:nitronate monooxygenase [Beijerinckiaceae bacterium]VVB46746.1 Nitronate monooxygenase [Beijerinckiaceae bacterium RH CH11]VVB46829.1 Nitronate monooxygenase [Beijerinckiaceae bacterium RH AL8]VVC55537.1 Nitronate monooxygenase [Beijerinckiaceae bacterium RH AL1]
MAIATRLTRRFGIEHPIVLAPMVPAAGGALASAVAEAGGLGLLGGGYADRAWFEAQSAKVTRDDVGMGFITWSIPDVPGLLEEALARHPRAMMLSFADPAPYAPTIKAAGVPLICQVHTLEQALRAVDVGADVVVAQGTEAGGHGLAARSTLPFVPAVVDALATRAPDVLVLAAGGIGDGRGLAAALMLGADGVLMGTRFWATREAVIPEAAKHKVLAATGDETIRTSVYDIVKDKPWPAGYTGRQMRNAFIESWHGREAELAAVRAEELARVTGAWDGGDFDTANVTVGETIGLVRDLPSAGEIVRRTVAEAEAALRAGSAKIAA